MKFKIGKPTSVSAPKDVFEIVIEFMEGDADGYDTEKILLAGTYKDLAADHPKMIELEKFIGCIYECIKRDSRGRGGFCSTREFTKHYAANGNEDLAMFCEDVNLEVLDLDEDVAVAKSSISLEIPCETYEGYYHSFESMDIFYYDDSGVQHKVSIAK